MAVTWKGRPFTNKQAYTVLNDLKTELFGDMDKRLAKREDEPCLLKGFEFLSEDEAKEFKPDAVAGDGHTFTYFDDGEIGVESVIVVIHSEFLDPDKENELANMDHFLDDMFAIFHEARHAEQALFLSRDSTELGNLLFLANTARQSSEGYEDEIYFRNPEEIDAQHLALRRGYKFLSNSDRWGGLDATDCVLSYQQRRNRNLSTDYIPKPKGEHAKESLDTGKASDEDENRKAIWNLWKKDERRAKRYKSVEAVFDAYRTSFLESVHAWRPRGIKGFLFGQSVLDVFLKKNGSYIRFCSEEDGYKQLEMASAAYIDHYYDRMAPDRINDLRSHLLKKILEERGLDLSVDATFGKVECGQAEQKTPAVGKYGNLALTCFDEVMRHVSEEDLLTEREKKGVGRGGPGE